MFATYEPRSRDVPCIHKPPAKESNAEGDLVRRLQAGNHAGFSDFVERYQSKVCRVAYGILGNRDDADDIVQQVFMQVYFSIVARFIAGSIALLSASVMNFCVRNGSPSHMRPVGNIATAQLACRCRWTPYPTASSGWICGSSGAREWTVSTASSASWGRRTAITVANIPEPSFRIRPTVWS